MSHDRYLTSVQEAVDGTLGSIRRAELEMHLAECAECRALLEDLQAVRDAASALPPIAAPDRTWLQIAGRLRQEGRIREVAPPARAWRPAYGWLALAATLVIAAGGWLLTHSPAPAPLTTTVASGTPGTGNAGTTKSVETVQNEVDAAQQQFEKAIADLEKVAKANQSALDPGTSATIEKNLGIIDQAIAENRAAVKSEPTSVAARETLFETLRQKVSLLQDTIALINEMRKGNNAAAAQLLNKS